MKDSKDSEFIKFRNNILVVFLVTGICIIFVILFFGKGLVGGPISRKMKNNDTFLTLRGLQNTLSGSSPSKKVQKILQTPIKGVCSIWCTE